LPVEGNNIAVLCDVMPSNFTSKKGSHLHVTTLRISNSNTRKKA